METQPDGLIAEDWQPDDPFVDAPPDMQGEASSAPVSEPAESSGIGLRELITGERPPQKKFLGPWMSAPVRPVVQAIGGTLLPGDAFQGVRNLAMGTNYQHPSAALETLLDKYTTEPEGLGKAAEFVTSAMMGGKSLKLLRQAPQVIRQVPALFNSAKARAAAVIKAGEKHDVPVFYEDVAQSPMAQKLSAIFENLGWLGTGAGREKQAAAVTRAAGRELHKFRPQIPPGSTAVDEEVPVLVQEGLRRRLSSFKSTADTLYKRAARLLDPAGNFNTPRFNNELNKAINDEKALGGIANKDLMQKLLAMKGATTGDFSHNRKIRTRLGSMISEYYTGKNTTIGADGAQYLQRMRDGLEQDMADFAKQMGTKNPNAFDAWKKADEFYKKRIVPFKEPGFKDLVNTAEPERAWKYLITEGGIPSRMRRMYNSLDDAGRSAVRYGMVKDAYEHARVPAKAGAPEMISPAKFAKYLEDHEEVMKHFFRGNDRAEIDGFRNLMRHVERAGQYMENPPTGNRLSVLFLLRGPWIAAGATTKVLFQTNRGRDLLLGMSRAKPGSAAERALSGRIGRYLASSWAMGATGTSDDLEGDAAAGL